MHLIANTGNKQDSCLIQPGFCFLFGWLRIAESRQVEWQGQSSSNWISFMASKKSAPVARVRSAGAAWENFQAAEDVHEGNIKELMRSFAMRVKPLAAYVTAEGREWGTVPHIAPNTAGDEARKKKNGFRFSALAALISICCSLTLTFLKHQFAYVYTRFTSSGAWRQTALLYFLSIFFLSNSLLALICLVSSPLSFSLYSLSLSLSPPLPFSNFFVWSATVRTRRPPSQQQEKKKKKTCKHEINYG